MIIKNILLTGASSGIGEALAIYYAKQPQTENLFICGRNEQRLNEVKKKCEKIGHAKIHTKIFEFPLVYYSFYAWHIDSLHTPTSPSAAIRQ